MDYDCETIELEAQPTLSIRTRTSIGDMPQTLDEGYGTIAGYLNDLGEKPAGSPYVAYFNMDMENLDIELGIPVGKELQGQGRITVCQMPGGTAATCVHTGPYDGLKEAYRALSQWIQEQGHQMAGVAYEVYVDDPRDTPPEQLRTRILFPLK
jgi:effector-binding domain-containing protein